jgi:hypothetical protein
MPVFERRSDAEVEDEAERVVVIRREAGATNADGVTRNSCKGPLQLPAFESLQQVTGGPLAFLFFHGKLLLPVAPGGGPYGL